MIFQETLGIIRKYLVTIRRLMPFQKVGDVKVHYHVSGEGEPLLLVAGLFGDLHNWKKTVPLFEKDYKVIICDNRGSGLTEAPSDQFVMGDLADDAAGLLTELGIEKAHILGWSMGGNVAQEIAINHSDLTGTLTLMSTYTREPDRSRYAIEAMLHSVLEGADLYTFNAMMQAWCSTDAHLSGKLYRPTRRGSENRGEDLRIINGYVQQKRALDAFDNRERLHMISAPTLVVHGDSDIMVSPYFADELVKGISSVEQYWVPGAGHFLSSHSYAERVMQFLNSHPLDNFSAESEKKPTACKN